MTERARNRGLHASARRGARAPHGPAPAEALTEALAEYAEAVLDPQPSTLARVRQRALLEFAQRRAPRRTPDRAASPGRLVFLPRRAALLVAASLALLLAASGLVTAASGPGQPFYRVRLTLEELALPPQDGEARLEAQLARLGARLDEAERAGDRGDERGVADAASAYEEVLDKVLAGSESGAASSGEVVSSALQNHVTVLESLVGKVPEQAQGAVQHALARASKARDAIEQAPGQGGDKPGNGNGSDGAEASPGPAESGGAGAAESGTPPSWVSPPGLGPTP